MPASLGHHDLHVEGGILHRNPTVQNIILEAQKMVEDPELRKALLTNLDAAIYWDREKDEVSTAPRAVSISMVIIDLRC